MNKPLNITGCFCHSKGFLTESGRRKASVILSTEDQSNFQITQMKIKVRLRLVSPFLRKMFLPLHSVYSPVCVIRCEKEPLEPSMAWCSLTRRKMLLTQRNILSGSKNMTRGTTRTTKSLCKTRKDPSFFLAYRSTGGKCCQMCSMQDNIIRVSLCESWPPLAVWGSALVVHVSG